VFFFSCGIYPAVVDNSLATNGLADAARSDAMPEAAGGEDGHGAAKLRGVVKV